MRRLSETSFLFDSHPGQHLRGPSGQACNRAGHDRRVYELSRYHGVPTNDLTVEGCSRSEDELYERVDFAEFNRGHAERFDKLSDFVHEYGFNHIYDRGQERAPIDSQNRLASMHYLAPQTTLWHDMPPQFVRVTSVLQHRCLALEKTQKNLKAGGRPVNADDDLSIILDRLRNI